MNRMVLMMQSVKDFAMKLCLAVLADSTCQVRGECDTGATCTFPEWLLTFHVGPPNPGDEACSAFLNHSHVTESYSNHAHFFCTIFHL